MAKMEDADIDGFMEDKLQGLTFYADSLFDQQSQDSGGKKQKTI